MADAPTGPNNKSNPYYAKRNHVRLAKVDRNKREFFGTIGGVVPPPAFEVGTEMDLTIELLPDNAFYGFNDDTNTSIGGAAGALDPAEFESATIATLRSSSAGSPGLLTLINRDNAPFAGTPSSITLDFLGHSVVMSWNGLRYTGTSSGLRDDMALAENTTVTVEVTAITT